MGLKARIIACVAAVALLAPACAQAEIFNGSFESNLDEWTANDDLVFITGEWHHRTPPIDGFPNGDDDFNYFPVDGAFLGVLTADAQDIPTLVSQTFTTRGGRLSGWAAFLGEDDQPFNDYGFVRLVQMDDEIEMFSISLFSAGIASLGSYGYTPWTNFALDLAPGEYMIEAGAVNVGDGSMPSYLLLDAFRVSVPEPATWALMLTGFFGMGAMLRRQRRPLPVRIRRD